MGASVLARIPEVGRSRRPTHVWTADQDPAFLEAFEFLRLNLQLICHDGEPGGRGDEPRRRRRQEHGGGMAGPVAGPQRRGGRGRRPRPAQARAARLPERRSASPAPACSTPCSPRTPTTTATRRRSLPRRRTSSTRRMPSRTRGNGERAPHGRRVYTDDDVTAGLVELARFGGNARRAARSLKGAGRDIPSPPCAGGRTCTPISTPRSASARARGTVGRPAPAPADGRPPACHRR